MSVLLFLGLAVVALAAIAFAVLPVWRAKALKGRGLLVAAIALFLLGVGGGTYFMLGQPYLAWRSAQGVNTRDVNGAKAFYGSVFGWDTLSTGGAEMWTLPGYGDHLEQLDPGIRKRVAEVGGPVGFEDVVASINPIADDKAGIPAHWSVTFAVDDADAVAETAAALGGTVVVPPFDAPWVGMTAITDPQGATFVASRFVLENKDLGSQADAVGAR